MCLQKQDQGGNWTISIVNKNELDLKRKALTNALHSLEVCGNLTDFTSVDKIELLDLLRKLNKAAS